VSSPPPSLSLPELPVDVDAVTAFCRQREAGPGYTLICIAEGAHLQDGELTVRERIADNPIALSTPAA